MNKIFLISGGVAALIALLALLAFALPRQVHVERRALVAAPASALYTLAISNRGYQRFNPFKTADPSLDIKLFGPASGVGSGFRFEGGDGNGTQTVARLERDRSIEFAVEMDDYGPSTQTLSFEPTEGGTMVTWAMDKDMGNNPIGRVFGALMDSMVGKHFAQGLENLGSISS